MSLKMRTEKLLPPALVMLIFSLVPVSAEPSTAVNQKETKIAQQSEFGPYMADLQRRIKRDWFPPKNSESKRVKCVFKVHSDGTIEDVRVVRSGGNAATDQAAKVAIEHAAPFRPLPAGAPKDVDIEFTFDYNVFNNIADSTTVEIIGLAKNAPVAGSAPENLIYLPTYCADLSRKLKDSWHPPKGSQCTTESIKFKIHKDGTMSDLWLGTVTGDDPADHAALEAVTKAAPYAALPGQVGDELQARVTMRIDVKDLSAAKPMFDVKLSQSNQTAIKRSHLEVVSAKLVKLWSHRLLEGEKHTFSLGLNLDNDGFLNNANAKTNIQVYNSSGNQALDEFAKDCVKRSAPFDLNGIRNTSGNYLASFDTLKKSAVIVSLPDVDWRSYLALVESAVPRHLQLHNEVAGGSVAFTVKVHSDGSVSDVKVASTESSSELQGAGREAINKAMPFWPLPAQAPDAVDLKITFGHIPKFPAGVWHREPDKQASPTMDQSGSVREYPALQKENGKPEVIESNGDIFRIREQNDSAISEYKAAAKLTDSARIEVKLGQAYQSKGDLVNAIAAYGRAITMKSDDPDVVLALVSSWEAVLKTNSTAPENHIGYGQALMYASHFDEARAQFENARELSPNKTNPDAEKFLRSLPEAIIQAKISHLINLGVDQQIAKQYQKAIVAYNDAKKLVRPDDEKNLTIILTNMGTAYQAMANYKQAINYYEQTLKLDACNVDAIRGIKTSRVMMEKKNAEPN